MTKEKKMDAKVAHELYLIGSTLVAASFFLALFGVLVLMVAKGWILG